MPRRQDSDGAEAVASVSTNSRGSSPSPFATPSVRTLLRATSVLSSEATKLAAQGNLDLASGVLFLDLSECRGHGPLSPLGFIDAIERIQLELGENTTGAREIIKPRILEFWKKAQARRDQGFWA